MKSNRYIISFIKDDKTIFERFITKSSRYTKVMEQINTAIHQKYNLQLDKLENLQVYHEKIL